MDSGAQLTDHRLVVSVLKNGLEETHDSYARGGDPEARLLSLASALSTSPPWAEMPRATFVVRPDPVPLLGVIGYFDEADRARLEGLSWQLETTLPRMRYVGYDRAEEDCERLAERLVERFGRDGLRGFRFTAIPRGGFIVLGMLSYILGLERSQLEPSHTSDAPLVVVDDCAISGVRFGEFLEGVEGRPVVFASLYSPPELRIAIEAREGDGVVCVSACDLRDHARETQGDDYPDWRERWSGRSDGSGYWVGQPDHVCFAWNEPDTSLWNPITEQEEGGWRFVPPEMCLKNRISSGDEAVRVEVQTEGKGPIKPSSRALFGELEGGVVVGNLDTGESFVLDDAAVDMWRAIVGCGNLEEAAEDLLKDYDVDGATLRADMREFADDLLSRGLLEDDG